MPRDDLRLERLVLNTSLPLLVLDPDGDHVHLGACGPGADAATARAYAEAARIGSRLTPEGGADVSTDGAG